MMDRRLPFMTLAALAAVFSAAIGWQLVVPSGDVPAAPPRATQATTASLPPAPPAAAAAQTTAWAATTLARPLFRPDRRPAVPGASSPAAAEEPLPRLTGIMVTAEGRSAIFAGKPQPVVLREGGRLGTFTVHTIEAGLVTLRGPDGQRELRPSFDGTQAAQTLPVSLPPLPGAVPPPTGSPPGLPDGAKDVIPFGQKPVPSGLDIIRNQAGRAPGNEAPAR